MFGIDELRQQVCTAVEQVRPRLCCLSPLRRQCLHIPRYCIDRKRGQIPYVFVLTEQKALSRYSRHSVLLAWVTYE